MYRADDNLYSIQFVSNVTGINPHTIRAWEKRYGATSPIRDKNGRRLYSDKEIQRLDMLNKLVSIGNSISDIANLDRDQLSSVLEKYDNVKVVQEKTKVTVEEFDWTTHFQSIIAAVRMNKTDIVFSELSKCQDMMNAQSFIQKVLIPVLQEIFELSKSDLYQPIVFKPLCLAVKSFIFNSVDFNRSTRSSRKVLVSAFDGDLNDVVGMLVAAIFKYNGDEVIFVGQGNTVDEIEHVCHASKADIVFLAAGYSPEKVISNDEKTKVVTQLAELELSSEIFVGSFNQDSTYRGVDIEYISSFDLLFSILENT